MKKYVISGYYLDNSVYSEKVDNLGDLQNVLLDIMVQSNSLDYQEAEQGLNARQSYFVDVSSVEVSTIFEEQA